MQPYLINSFKAATELPTETCSSKCDESLKGHFKINAGIIALMQKYNKIIKHVDVSKSGEVLVTYWKV